VDSVGRRLKEERQLKGWSQRDLARETGVNPDTISGIETEQHEPRPSTLRKLAEGLGLEVRDFFAEPALPKAEAPTSPDEWAREIGVRLHGMSDEEWDAYIRRLESVNEIEQVFRELFEERVMLHAALRADKWVRPENRAQRAELMPGIRELRVRRMADLEASALVRRAESLVNEIHEVLLQETHS
jgi:transcriptional regulator with XRE-family HTH domain